jgi:hypothetical protein
MLNKFKTTIILTISTPILIIICVVLMGGGHGYFEPTFVVFPFATILFAFFNTMNYTFLFASLIQYPIYGLLIDKLRHRFNLIAFFIVLVHITLILISYSMRPEAFK